jgi:hypothetical protein
MIGMRSNNESLATTSTVPFWVTKTVLVRREIVNVGGDERASPEALSTGEDETSVG